MAKKNEFEEIIGEKWAKNHFSELNQGYIVRTRAHTDAKHTIYEEVAYKPEQIKFMINKLNELKKDDNFLVIVRTFTKGGKNLPTSCYFISVSHKILEKYKNRNMYFYSRKDSEFGIDYWEKTGLVKYHPIEQLYLFST